MSTQHTHMGKNELVPAIEGLQKRGAVSKVMMGAVVGLMAHGAAAGAELGRNSDPREAQAYAAFTEIFKGQKTAADPAAKFVLEPDAPVRSTAKTVVAQAPSKKITPGPSHG